jgi:phosphate-selective porin OprO/OprP
LGETGLFKFNFRRTTVLNKTRFKYLGYAIIISCITVLATPSFAANETMLELLKILRDKGSLTQEEYNLLVNAAKAEGDQVEAVKQEVKEDVEKQVAEATRDVPKVKTKGKLEVSSQDGDFKWRVGGRIMADAAFYDEDNTDLGSGTEFRRARLYMSGTMWRDWDFKVQFDFAEDGISGKDLYVRYTGLKPAKISVGHIKEQFSLEELTSSKYITFMERALPIAFAPGRNMGVGVHTHFADRVTVAAGIFGEGVSDSAGTTSEGYGATGRITFSPVHEKSRAVHLGGAVSWRTPDDDDTLRFRERPESHISSTRLVDTGTLSGVDDYWRYNIDAAAILGPFALQGEYFNTDVNRESGFGSDLDFDGYYIQGSWFLTGESRNYKWTSGNFSGIKPKGIVGKGGIGAWQVGARFSTIDLTDRTVIGGEEDNITVGLNWYPNANLRFMANYVHVLDLERPGNVLDGAEPSVFQLRAQAHW